MEKKDRSFEMLAKTLLGLEDVLAKELIELGAENIQILNRAVSFSGDMDTLYKANYCCRTALAILRKLGEFEANTDQELYEGVYEIPWEHILDVDCTFVIEPVVNSSIFRHSQYAGLKTKDAIVDRFRKLFNRRPNVDREYPDYYIGLHINQNKVTILLNSSGESLHKRGYRQRVGLAPINEVLAAGLIQLSGWQCDTHFFDPMCGSGTLLIEAAMLAGNIPAQFYRKDFAFKKWKEYNSQDWKRVIEFADKKISESDYEIWGSDLSAQAIENAECNIRYAKLHHDIQLFKNSFENQNPPEGRCIIITNPPYGERIQADDRFQMFEKLGNLMKHSYGEDKEVWIITSDMDSIKHVGLKPSRKIQLFNGALECRFLQYKLYEGSKKSSKQLDATQETILEV